MRTAGHFLVKILFLSLLLLTGLSAADPIDCTVGPSGDYPTIQLGLDGCNGGAGSIRLILTGNFFENVVVPDAVSNLTIASDQFVAGNVTAWPYPENMTVFWHGSKHQVTNHLTAVYLQGLAIDGDKTEDPFFKFPLINNNLTIDRCVVGNFSANITFEGDGSCSRGVSLNAINTRFQDNWGSSLYFIGMEDITVDSCIFERCGGYNNYSAHYLKMSFVAEGVFVVTNNSQWLLADVLPPPCLFYADQNGMTRCRNGTLECYNVQDTELLRPNCEKVEMTYIEEGTNLTKTVTDYPLKCRVYRPCECQNLEFLNTTDNTFLLLPIGDIFFYTGLRLNCSVENGTESVNATELMFWTSHAGSTGVGTTPPLSDPTMGYSLSPGIYLSGTINNSLANCSCPALNRSLTLQDAGLKCEYSLGNATYTDTGGEIPLKCIDGGVKNCTLHFLRCFELSDALKYQLNLTNTTSDGFCVNGTTLVNDTALIGVNDTFTNCTRNSTLVMPDGTTLLYPGDGSVPYQIVGDKYICLGYFTRNTTFTVLVEGLTENTTAALCNSSSLFPNGTDCPEISSNVTYIYENSTCDTCNSTVTLDSTVILVMACSPWYCPANYTVNCTYEYFDPALNTTVQVLYSYNYTVFDGYALNTSETWNFPNGTAMCPDFTTLTINGTNYTQFVEDLCTEQDALSGYYATSNDTSLCNYTDPSTNLTFCCFNETMLTNGTDGCNVTVCVIPDVLVIDVTAELAEVRPRNETAPCGVNYTCEADLNVTSCSCVLDYVVNCLTPYIPGNASAAYHWDNIRNETSFVDITGNRAQQLPTGLLLDRTTEWIVYNTSVILPDRSTENARLREIIKQSPQIYGRIHDSQYGLFGDQYNIAPYRFYCDAGCPLDYTQVSDFQCIVDASTPKPQVNRTYQTIQLAIDDDCKTILVINYENYYTDQIIFRNKVKLIVSFDGACVLNYGHELRVDNLEIRGMCFLHPGDESVPVFSLKQDMESLTILNSYFDGGNVRGAGIIDLGAEKWIDNLVVNHTHIEYFNYAVFILWRIRNVWMSHNLFYSLTGRVVDIVYNSVFRFHDNSLVKVRGVSNSGGNTIIRFMGRSEVFFWLFDNGDDADACSPEAEEAFGYPCAMYNNVQMVDVTEPDNKDVCYTIVGGQITFDKIFDNFCVKAQTGMQLRGLQNLTQATVPLLLARNTGIRPSLFIVDAKPSRVHDFVYDIYLNSDTYFFFKPYVTLAVNYPGGYPEDLFPVCTVNPNYDIGYVGNKDQQITPFGLQNITSYGFGLFHNFSQAIPFCGVKRVNNITGGVEVPIYATGHDGGRMFRDSFDITQVGLSFYGALMPDEEHVMPVCFPRSQVFGDGFRILADNFTMANMSFMRDNRMIEFGRDMFTTNPRIASIWNLNITNNTFDGGNLPAYSYNRIFNLQPGFDATIYEASNTPRGGNRRPYKQTLKNMTVVIERNTFQNFSSFESTNLLDPDTGQVYNTTIQEYPFTDPIFIWFLSEDSPSFGKAFINYNTFLDVDRRVVDVRYAINTTFIGNVVLRSGGRSPGNSAVVYIQSNRKHPSNLTMTDNFMSQTKSILSEKTQSTTNPGYLASILIRGYDNGTMCIENNTVSDMPVGLRFAGGKFYDRLLSCVDPATNPPQFYDNLDNLRRIYFTNRNLTGYIHWLVYAEIYQDFPGTWLYCDDGCVPGTPAACNVSLTDPAYVPTHPWWDTLVFRDINRAIERCALPGRRVRVLPNHPPQDYVLTINPQFIGNESNCNYTDGNTQIVFADVTDAGTNPVRIKGCRHQLPACAVTFENFYFVHDCNTTTDPTWFTNVTDPTPLPLPRLGLINNTFDGQGTAAPAIAPLADDRLMIGDHAGGTGKQVFYLAFQQGSALAPTRGNLFTDYSGPAIVNVTGRSCLVNVTAQFNIWDRSPGNAIWVAGVGSMNLDYNNFINSGGLIAGPESLVYVNICIPNANSTGKKFELTGRFNQILNDNTYTPLFINLTTGGYFTGFWFDPVPYDKMPVSIGYNRGNVLGVCMRQDNRPDSSSLLDPQAEARKISLSEKNFFCNGSNYDIRFLKGPGFDNTVDTDLVLYRKYYCNDGCAKVDEAQMSITLGILFGILGAIIFALVFYFCTRGRPWMYFSGILGRYIPVNPLRWEAYGVMPGDEVNDYSKNKKRVHQTRNSQYGYARGGW